MSKYKILYSKEYKKAIKKFKKDICLIENIIDRLANDEILEPKYKDHKLKGEYKDFRECHIKPDLLLIYKIDKEVLILVCISIGSHSDLF